MKTLKNRPIPRALPGLPLSLQVAIASHQPAYHMPRDHRDMVLIRNGVFSKRLAMCRTMGVRFNMTKRDILAQRIKEAGKA